MRKQLFCEWRKTKGKLISILFPVLAFLSAWLFWLIHDPDAEMMRDGYTYMTSSLILLNSIFLPATAAVMASRMMDMEIKGNTYKLLCTLQKKSSIFTCKLAVAILHLVFYFTLQGVILFLLGKLAGLTEVFPLLDYLLLQSIGALVSTLLFILQIFLSLVFENQLYPLFFGLLGSFVGLFSQMLSPDSPIRYFLPWGYFSYGASSLMCYDEASKTTYFLRIPFNATGFCVLTAALLFSFLAVRSYFLRKDV